MEKNGYGHMVLDYYVERLRAMRAERHERLSKLKTKEDAIAYQQYVRGVVDKAFGPWFNEIKSRCVDQHRQYPWEIWWQGEHERKNGENAPIGFELAESFFTCRAYIEK